MRHRSTRRRRDERGSLLIEAILFMFVLSIVATSYVTSTATMNALQRRAQTTDALVKIGSSALTRATGLPWERFGLCASDLGYANSFTLTTSGGDLSYPVVTIPDAVECAKADRLLPKQTVRTRESVFEVETSVGADTPTTPTSMASYGRRIIVVRVTGTVNNKTYTRQFVAFRAPDITETAPHTKALVS